jgi:hypothetical protein
VPEQTKYRIALVSALVVGAAAVTSQSLWIDEGAAALKAMQPNLHHWWQALRTEGHSNLQLVFQLLYLWGWEKIFGSSEYGLRASNIPFFAVAAVAMMSIFPKRTRLQMSVLWLTLTNAFLWYYLGEARPYIVLFAFAAITTACLLRLIVDETISNSPAWFRLFCTGLTGLCATSLVAIPWAMGAALAASAWLGLTGTRRLLCRFRYTAAFTTAALVALAGYYFWTMQIGARASDVGRTETKNLFYVLYELSGLAGLGPGRLDLREHGIAALQPFRLTLCLGGLAVLALSSAGVSALLRKIEPRYLIVFGFAIGLPFLFVLAAGYVGQMRLLGRHFTPLLPFVLVFLALGLDQLLSSPRVAMRVTALFSLAMLALSALEIRFVSRHQRDDYRAAAAVAQKAIAEGKKVWWLADESTGQYYKLPFASPNLTPGPNLSDESLTAGPIPDLVCLSKPDIYDAAGKIDNYLRAHDFEVTRTFPAFQIFERQPASR